MSGASIPCCPVCGDKIYVSRDWMEYTLMAEYWHCKNCKLAYSEWVTGCGEERIGFTYFQHSYTDSDDEGFQRRRQTVAALDETRRLWNDPNYQQWRPVVDASVTDNPTLYLIFADWLLENGYELNDAAVRQSVEWHLNPPF